MYIDNKWLILKLFVILERSRINNGLVSFIHCRLVSIHNQFVQIGYYNKFVNTMSYVSLLHANGWSEGFLWIFIKLEYIYMYMQVNFTFCSLFFSFCE